MLSFVDLDRSLGLVPGPVVTALGRVDVARGREELFRNQAPAMLTTLAHRARIASITASSALEGVVVPDQSRAAAIIGNRARTLRTRNERELAGYRAALDYLMAEDWRPLNLGLILHLHRLLFGQTPTPGGRLKQSDNLVVDRSPDGSTQVRFTPVPAVRTEHFLTELIARYVDTVQAEGHHPVLRIGLFVLDLLTIHPFEDGNGRVARVLTNALLDDAGYSVGRFVSLEQTIAESADRYYATLLASTHGWHDQRNDPWPWLTYFVDTVAEASARFERGVSKARPLGTKQDRVRDHVLHASSQIFSVGDVRAALPGISDQTIRLVLEQLKREGLALPEGRGRSAVWVRRTEA